MSARMPIWAARPLLSSTAALVPRMNRMPNQWAQFEANLNDEYSYSPCLSSSQPRPSMYLRQSPSISPCTFMNPTSKAPTNRSCGETNGRQSMMRAVEGKMNVEGLITKEKRYACSTSNQISNKKKTICFRKLSDWRTSWREPAAGMESKAARPDLIDANGTS